MIVLASASAARRDMLARAGVSVAVDAARVDEAAVKREMADSADPGEVAEALAERKAGEVSARHPGAVVIGADQMLDCDGVWLDKPTDRAEARRQLAMMRGRTHRLLTAAVVIEAGLVRWRCVDTAELAMRDFSDAFLERYLDQAGQSVYSSVGGYQLEGPGVQLFERVSGDFFCILGLPLLQLLGFLREAGALLR